MSTYTIEIQASDEAGDIWQALEPAETVDTDADDYIGDSTDTAVQVAEAVAAHQNLAEGTNWRVRVWDGPDADTGTEPAAEAYAPDRA